MIKIMKCLRLPEVNKCATILITILVVTAVNFEGTNADGRCVMHDLCGENPDRPGFQLNCVYSGPPRTVDEESYDLLRKSCPELTSKFGNQLCCAGKQITELVDSLAFPEAIIGKCPACFHNFRQVFCAIACSPNQFEFLSAKEIVSNGEGQPMVKTLETYVEDEYVENTYDSCKGVKMPGEGDYMAMGLFCGPWGAENCTAHRWFDYMGSTENGFAPFDIMYKFIKENEAVEGVIPFKYPTLRCTEVPVNPPTRCSCEDCKDSCKEPWKIVDNSYQL